MWEPLANIPPDLQTKQMQCSEITPLHPEKCHHIDFARLRSKNEKLSLLYPDSAVTPRLVALCIAS